VDRGTTAPRGVRALLFLLVWLSVAWFGSWELNPNNATRMFAALSLVEQGDATIDEYAPLTIDKAQFGPHAYLDKAPGMTLMALPAVAIVDRWSGTTAAGQNLSFYDPTLARFLRLRMRVAVATGPAWLTALAAVLLFDWGMALTGQAGAGLVAALGYALGTPIWGWSGTITGHAVVAALYVIAGWCLWRATGPGERRVELALAGGMALGWAVVVEYQAVLAGGAIALWAAARAWPRADRWRVLGFAALGGVAMLVPLALYNLLAFGTPFRIAYAGVTGFAGMQQGLFGLTWPRPKVLLEIVLGDRRGLVWVAPILVLGVPGLARLADDGRTRGLAAMAGGVVAIVLLVNAAYFYWDGGNSTGPRHAVPAIGMLALGLAPFWAERGRWGRVATAALLALSMAVNLVIAAADIFAPPDYRWPVWTYVIEQRFRPGALQSWPSEWLGWSAWSGLSAYLAVALPLMAVLLWRVRRGSCGCPAPGARHRG